MFCYNTSAMPALRIMMVVLLAAYCRAYNRPEGLALDCVPAVSQYSFEKFPAVFMIKPPENTVPIVSLNSTKIEFAEQFTVEYFSFYKIVTNTITKEKYQLIQCGAVNAVPQSELIPEAKVFFIPLASVGVIDTTVAQFLADLEVIDRVAYSTPYVVNPCLQKLATDCQRAKENSTGLNSTLVDAYFSSDAPDVSDPLSITFSAASDPGVLRRAEWYKFVATFFNRELEANALFDSIASNYTSLVQTNTSGPLVAWVAMVPPFPGYSNYLSYQILLPTYKTQYITDAGGRALNATELVLRYKSSGVVSLDPSFPSSVLINYTRNSTAATAVLRDLLGQVDAIVDETYHLNYANVTAAEQITPALFAAAWNLPAPGQPGAPRALTQPALYRLDGRVNDGGFLDWFEGAVARPDLVLRDFVALLAPARLEGQAGGSATRWLWRVGGGANAAPEVVSAKQCTATSSCQLSAEPICPYVHKDCVTGELVASSPEQRCGAVCTPPPPGNGAREARSAALPMGAAAAAGAALLALLLL